MVSFDEVLDPTQQTLLATMPTFSIFFVTLVIFGSEKKALNLQDYKLVIYTIGITVQSFGAAAVVSVFVEFPIANLVQFLFKMASLGHCESSRTGDDSEGDNNRSHDTPKDESVIELSVLSTEPAADLQTSKENLV